MARTSLEKRLKEAESKAEAQQRTRNEAAAREVTPARLEEIMLQLESSYRGGEEANTKYIKSLTTGELLRVHRESGVSFLRTL